MVGAEDEIRLWDRVIANLSDGRARLLFLADRIPTELQANMEFLNERIDPTEVLAVELQQYRTPDGPQVLVPSVIGSTAAAKSTKRVSMPYADLLASVSEHPQPQLTQLSSPTNFRSAPIPRRYDLIMATNSFDVLDVRYRYRDAIDAGSDHGLVEATLRL